MRTQIQKQENVSHTIQSKTRATNQADVHTVLQRYAKKQVGATLAVVQREELPEEELLQGKFDETIPNQTGIPDGMKSGFESMSGFSFDDVRVHYNSDKPAQLNALAYTQGNQVHIAPGQEKHLGHELGHVVQQKQGRVQPTMQLQGVNVNDDDRLEREADMMEGKIIGSFESAFSPVLQGKFSPTSNLLQRKIRFLDTGKEINKNLIKNNGELFGKISKKYRNNELVTAYFNYYNSVFFVTKKDFFEKIGEDLLSDENELVLDNATDESWIINTGTFLFKAVENMGPNPKNFDVDRPKPGNIKIQYLNTKLKSNFIPDKKRDKKPGYVVNIASYYKENGVKGITKRYFEDALSGEQEEKAKKIAVVIGLNSFSSVIDETYSQQIAEINNRVEGLELPKYSVNFCGFGFLWEPFWLFDKKPLPYGLFRLRKAIKDSNDPDDRRKQGFIDKQKKFSENYPYGVFREVVMKYFSTQMFVDKLSSWNNPVYIYSGDGDAISLKVPNEHDTGMSEIGVVDKYDEHFGTKGTDAKIVIGGYNLYNLKEDKILQEIVKADKNITKYADDTDIDKTKPPSPNLGDYKDRNYLQKRIKQIVHNTQVGNRYDKIIRDAISTVYPKMLYPTEPNMLIKAKDSTDDYDFFKGLPQGQGALWGMGASEGRVFKENLEKRYQGTSDGKEFIDWVPGASLPTDPRGFNRHLIISGYEKHPSSKEVCPPFAKFVEGKKGQDIPLIDAAVQQAQSYTSAYRLAELYAQSITSKCDEKNETRKTAKSAFDKVEEMVKYMMQGDVKNIEIVVDQKTGDEVYDKISMTIRTKLKEKWDYYLRLSVE